MNNYYEEFLKQIEQLIIEQNYVQAKVLLKQELDLPYIPVKYEKQIIELYNLVQNKSKDISKINQWDLPTILEILNNPFDEEIHLVAFTFLREHNIRKILPDLKKYLINPLFKDENKTHLLLVLKQQEIDESIIVKKTHGEYTINPKEMLEIYETKVDFNVRDFLQKNAGLKNPSLEQVCYYIWENYWYANYPKIISINEVSQLATAIIYKAKLMQGDNEQTLLNFCQELDVCFKDVEVLLSSLDKVV